MDAHVCLNQVDRQHYSVADDKLSKLDDHDAGRFKKDPSDGLIDSWWLL